MVYNTFKKMSFSPAIQICQKFFSLFLCFLVLNGCRNQDVVRIHLMDVGYGDSILIEAPDGKNILIDAGDMGHGQKVLHYLRRQDVTRIHLAVITHPHENHFGGFFVLLDDIVIDAVLINGQTQGEEGYAKLLKMFEKRNIPVSAAKRGDKISSDLDDGRIDILHPQTLDGSPNDNSIVMQVTFNKTSILLTGDVEKKVQEELFRHFRQIKDADVVKLPHHGRDITENMIAMSGGKIFLISTGPNRWGPPDEEKISKLQGTVYRTDRDGDVVLESDGQRWQKK
jgi:competence protein ComEC